MKNFTNYLLKSIFISFLFFIFSCSKSDDYKNKPINNFGGYERNSSYEFLGDFYTYSAYIDYPKQRIESGAIQQPLALFDEKIVCATSDGNIYCLQDNRNVLWKFKLDSGIVVSTGMCADEKENIYALGTDFYLYSIDKEGKLNWKYKVSDTIVQFPIFSELLCTNDGVYVGSNFGLIAKFSFSGKCEWQIQTPLSVLESFSATKNGSIVVPISHNSFGESDSLLYINPDGKIKWKRALNYIRILKHPAIFGDRISLPAVFDSNGYRVPVVVVLDTFGNLIWQKEVPVQPRYVSIDENGEIYVVGNNPSVSDVVSGIFCYSKSGELRWKLYIDMLLTHPVFVSTKKLVVSGFKSGAVATAVLKKEDGKLIKTISLNKFPILLLRPTVSFNRTIVYASSQELCFARIDDLFVNKIIPW